jgi:flagellum-specific ATP synthase
VLCGRAHYAARAADQAYLPKLTRACQARGDPCGHGETEPARRLPRWNQAEVNEVIRLHKPLEAFLAQGKEEATSLAEGYRLLAGIVAGSETER